MKLILAVVRDTDERAVIGSLVDNGYRVTRVASTGGFLKRGNITLMIGIEEEQLEKVIEVMKDASSPVNDQQHSVTLFVVNATHFIQV